VPRSPCQGTGIGWRRYVFSRRRQIAEDLEKIAVRGEAEFVGARRALIDAAREIVGVSLLESDRHG
jgi:hypothetical protein